MSSTAQANGHLLLPVAALWRREVVRFVRQRSRVIGAFATPIVFWLVLGSGLGRSFVPVNAAGMDAGAGDPKAMHYLEYFFPGTLAMIVLFTAVFSMISIIEDRREGFLQGVLVAPIRRSALVWGKVLGSTTLAVLQGIVFLFLAPMAGLPISAGSIALTVSVLLVIAIGLSGLGFLIAWLMESTQGFHAIMNLFLFPMWMLSGAAFPAGGASSWLSWVMALNPLTYGVAALRHALYIHGGAAVAGLPSLGLCLAVTVGFAGLMLVACARIVGRTPR